MYLLQVHLLYEELRQLHTERLDMAGKLSTARSAKELMRQLHDELNGVQVTVTQARRLRAEAEQSLDSVHASNADLEEALKERLSEIHDAHSQLDTLRMRKREQDAFDAADEFFHTNKAVLRSAYTRFKAGVRSHLRQSQLGRVMRKISHSCTQSKCWSLWSSFVARRRFLHASTERRGHERVERSMGAWKVYTILERLCKGARRRSLLRRVFASWAGAAREAKWELEGVEKTRQFHIRRRLRRAFRGWLGQAVILDWGSERTRRLERVAQSHYQRVVLRAWLAATKRSRLEDVSMLSARLPAVLLRRPFKLWRACATFLWRRRGQLLKRFFAHSCKIKLMRSKAHSLGKRAISHFLRQRQILALRSVSEVLVLPYMSIDRSPDASLALLPFAPSLFLILILFYTPSPSFHCPRDPRHWSMHARKLNRSGLTKRSLLRQGLYRHRRIVKGAVLTWAFSSACIRRQRMCLEAAAAFLLLGGYGGRTLNIYNII